jgi:hypothetical protein
MGRTLTECESERELEIVSVRWENAGQVRLLCREKGGQENSREPGWYAVFDTGKEQVVSHGRSMWVSSMAPDGITR